MDIKPTSALIRRLSDSFTTVYSYNDIKKYSPLDPTFSTLPQSVRDILINEFELLIKNHYTELWKFSKLDLPNNEPLFDIKSQDESEVLVGNVNTTNTHITHMSQHSTNAPDSLQMQPQKPLTPHTLSKKKESQPKNENFVPITRSMAVNKTETDSEDEKEINKKTVHFK